MIDKEQKNENMELYKKFGVTPKEAQKPITGGRLNGMTDINPMFRIKSLTEEFGPVGFGWYYEITNKWLEQGADNVVAAFVDINLYVKYKGEWSKPIQGTGGSSFVAKESKGLYTDDEAYKKALTDAISIACKSLGMCADIYYSKDSKFGTKYDVVNNNDNTTTTKKVANTTTKKVANTTTTTNTTNNTTTQKEYKIDIEFLSKPIGSGKYKEKTWLEVDNENPTYITWLVENAKDDESKQKFLAIQKALKESYISITQEMFDSL